MMSYDTEQKAEIDKIRCVFAGYFQSSHDIDFLWSDKLGYVFLYLEHTSEGTRVHNAEIVTDASDLCSKVLDEIMLDVLAEKDNAHFNSAVSFLDRAKIERRWKPYMDQLPEYRYLCNMLLNRLEG